MNSRKSKNRKAVLLIELQEKQLSAKLTQRIRRAFSKSKYPGDDRLSPLGDWAEGRDINRYFTGKRWQRCLQTRDTYMLGPVMLFFLHVDAFSYYLPAYLIHAIEHCGYTDDIASFFTKRFRPKYFTLSALTKEQHEVLVDVFIATCHNKDVKKQAVGYLRRSLRGRAERAFRPPR